jgi:hypothetical protein
MKRKTPPLENKTKQLPDNKNIKKKNYIKYILIIIFIFFLILSIYLFINFNKITKKSVRSPNLPPEKLQIKIINQYKHDNNGIKQNHLLFFLYINIFNIF